MAKIDISKLKPHKLNQKIYGDKEISQDFLDSIDEFGILVPLKVKPDNTIISGHRRWKAAKKIGLDKIPVETITFSSELAEREAILTYNKQRDKTYSQKMKEAEEWEDIEKEKAKEREDQTKRLDRDEKGQLKSTKPGKQNFADLDKGQSRDKIAEKIKIGSGENYRKAKKVWDEAEKGDKEAQKQVEKIDKGESSIHNAYSKVTEKNNDKNMDVHYSSDRDDWGTPSELFNRLDNEFNFSLDVCATSKTAKCDNYYSPLDDGLTQDWNGTCWMNPPYGQEISKWIEKAYEESKNKTKTVALIPSRTDTKWWHNYVMKASEIRFIKGRIKFEGAENSAPFPSAIVIFDNNKNDSLTVKSMEQND